MESIMLKELLSYIGVGVGGPALFVCVGLIILHLRTKKNTVDVSELKKDNKKQNESILTPNPDCAFSPSSWI